MKRIVLCAVLPIMLALTLCGCGAFTQNTNAEPTCAPASIHDDGAGKVTLTLYRASGVDGLEQFEGEGSKDAQGIWSALNACGAIDCDNVVVNELSIDQPDGAQGSSTIRLDLSGEFIDCFSRMGDTQEAYLVQSIVNTYTKNLEADALIITVDGSPLETGMLLMTEPWPFSDEYTVNAPGK